MDLESPQLSLKPQEVFGLSPRLTQLVSSNHRGKEVKKIGRQVIWPADTQGRTSATIFSSRV